MKDKFSKEFFIAALIRAIRTGAQTAVSLIAVGVSVFDIDWLTVIGITLTSILASLLTSLATDLPETKFDGVIDLQDQELYEGVKEGDIIRFKVVDGGTK